MKKAVFIALGAVVLLALGGGGAYAYLTLTAKPGKHAASPPKPSPIFFAQLADLVVSIPDQAGDPPADFVDVTLQFQTGKEDQLANFSTIEPIIRSQLIGILMRQSAKTLSDPAVRQQIEQQSLEVVNAALQSRHYAQTAPFTAAFITNLVVQD